MRVVGLGYVGVESPEYKVWEDLGPDVWGMGIGEPGADGTRYLRLDDRHHRLAIHPGPRNRLAYVGWEVASENAFDEAIVELNEYDIVGTTATDDELVDRAVERMVHFRAPSGVRTELFFAQQERYKSFRPGRSHGGFVTGEQGLGHIALTAPDPFEERRFYEGVIGLRLTDILVIDSVRSYFYRANRRHHSLVLGGPPGARLRGLRHIMIQVNELDDVGVALDQANSHNLPITLTLGRHSTDRMVSFYARTPSGFDIECGYDGREVVDDSWVVVKTSFPAEVWGHEHNPLPPDVNALAALEPAE